MKRVLENIVIYLALVFRPRMLVKIARDYQVVSEQLAETTRMATGLSQTLRDR